MTDHKLKNHYVPLLQQYGPTHQAVDWGSKQGQELRFGVLAGVGALEGASLLDVGCGVGHLVDFLAERGLSCDYLGIDVLPEMVAAASLRHPERSFSAHDLVASPLTSKWDYVFGSGLFTFEDRETLETVVRAMFNACNVAVAFNSLSAWAPQRETGEFYADPMETLAFCRTLTPWVALRHEYMPHDFTVYLYREPRRP